MVPKVSPVVTKSLTHR